MTDVADPARIQDAFLAECRRVLPNAAWSGGERPGQLLYSDASDALGRLEVWFDSAEITLCFGPKGYHQHHTLEDVPEDQLEVHIQRMAADAVEEVRALLADEIVVRWGFVASGTHRRQHRGGILFRLWRAVTPWVREAVWSGTAVR